MSSRTPFIAGNWKMFKTIAEAEAYVDALAPLVADVEGVDVAICVPFTALQGCVAHAAGTNVRVFAQNMHEAPEGAFTGEVSARMLEELDVAGTLLGHSERRQYFGETDRALREKIPAALARRPAPDPVRGGDRGGARARRHRAPAAPSGPGGAARPVAGGHREAHDRL